MWIQDSIGYQDLNLRGPGVSSESGMALPLSTLWAGEERGQGKAAVAVLGCCWMTVGTKRSEGGVSVQDCRIPTVRARLSRENSNWDKAQGPCLTEVECMFRRRPPRPGSPAAAAAFPSQALESSFNSNTPSSLSGLSLQLQPSRLEAAKSHNALWPAELAQGMGGGW